PGAPSGGGNAEQTVTLWSGWNWIGFHVLPDSHAVGDVLGTEGFTANDVIQTNGGVARYSGAAWLPDNFS
ncbi:hypothetical protein, partial [Pyramidobacter sp. C12-8]|uniref:hypothetical protein n=1 Tax=Pyramidobacter sp. C12-8 TaxID=1943580 RepID=UPI0009C9008D